MTDYSQSDMDMHTLAIAPMHPREAERLKALEAYSLLSTAPEEHLDEIVALVAEICGSSTAILSLVGEDHLWCKSRYNYDLESTDRAGSFCSHAILHDEVMVVEDASKDERFNTNPMVVCPTKHMRFYAGAPLLTEDGLPIGVLSALDHEPRSITPLQQRTLKILSKQIMAQLDLHKMVLNSRKSLLNLHDNIDNLSKNMEELKNKNDTALTLNQNKDKFIAIIAHDLKAAFHGLLGFSEILDSEFDELPPESMRKIASYLNETSHSTYKLLENLLEWAMLENGAMTFRPQTLDLERTVDSVATALHIHAEQKCIQIEQKIHKKQMVHADINMLKSLLQNLLSNAIKFSYHGSSIKIYSELNDERIHIFIEDTGTGMSQAQLDKLFKVELAQSTKGTGGEKGTGLGLLLSQQFAEQHGTQLQVKSEHGQGSVFSFSLPRIDATT